MMILQRSIHFLAVFLLALTCNHNGPLLVEADAGKAALSALKGLDSRYFIAGGTCAAISHGITTPIDVVKTKIQADPKKFNKGMISAAVDIMQNDGAGALLGGLGPTVVGYGIEGAMKFGVYEVMKPVFAALITGSATNKSGVAFLLASITAGAVAAMLLCPMESARIKIVTDPEYEGMGLLTGMPKMFKDDGLFASFGGMWAMLAKQVPYTFGKQVSFDVFAGLFYAFFRSLQDNFKNLADSQVKWAVSVFAAFCASLVACIFSQPGDMILTETFNKKKSNKGLPEGEKKIKADAPEEQRSFTEVIDGIYAEGGIPAFFTGTGARIVHVGLIITSQLVIYDIVKQLLGLPATGSH